MAMGVQQINAFVVLTSSVLAVAQAHHALVLEGAACTLIRAADPADAGVAPLYQIRLAARRAFAMPFSPNGRYDI